MENVRILLLLCIFGSLASMQGAEGGQYVVWKAKFERPKDGRTFQVQSLSKTDEALADVNFLSMSLPKGWECSEFKIDKDFAGELKPEAWVFRYSIQGKDTLMFSEFTLDYKTAVHSLCAKALELKNLTDRKDYSELGPDEWWPIEFLLEKRIVTE